MQPPTADRAVVRLLYPNQTPAGGGIYLSPEGHILTCAHVVRDALRPATPQAGDTLTLDFPLSANQSPHTAVLITYEAHPTDVALLQLQSQPPTDVTPAPLWPTTAVFVDQACRVFGFPQASNDGLWSKGEIIGPNSRGWLQIDGELTGYSLQSGFSGTAVWNETRTHVLGIVTHGDDDARAGLAIPTAVLTAVCPVLAPLVPQVNPTHIYLQHVMTRAEQGSTELERDIEERFVTLTLLKQEIDQHGGIFHTPDPEANRYDDLQELLQDIEQNTAVVLGQPGSGKTVLLRRLQLQHARGQNGAAPLPLEISLFAALRDHEPHLTPRDFLRQQWQAEQTRLPALALPAFDDWWQRPFLILLDGLNELPHAAGQYKARVQQWQRFLQNELPAHGRVVFSCRSLDYTTALSVKGQVEVRRIQVEPLTPAQIRTFLDKRLPPELAKTVGHTVEQDPDLQTLLAVPFFTRIFCEVVAATGQQPNGRASLITSLVRLALMRETSKPAVPPWDDARLLTESDHMLIAQEYADTPPSTLPSDGQLIPSLTALAYEMQDQQKANAEAAEADVNRVSLPRDKALAYLPPELGPNILRAGRQLNLLVEERPQGRIRFAHQLIQEYFSARALHEAATLSERVYQPWLAVDVSPSLAEVLATLPASEPLPGLPTSGWEETAVLAAALTQNPTQFLTQLAAQNLTLASRALSQPDVVERLSAADRETFEHDFQQALLARTQNPEVDLRARIVAAEALAELGDPRFEQCEGPHGPYLLPPFTAVVAGDYPLGELQGCRAAFWRRQPRIHVAAFEMAQFPVTNAEYGYFMRAGGYQQAEWWRTEAAQAFLRGEMGHNAKRQELTELRQILQQDTDENIRKQRPLPDEQNTLLAIKHMSDEAFANLLDENFPLTAQDPPEEPAYWRDSRFNHPSQPVVGLSWYEACAYCAWLSAQTGDTYDLPSEVEWEAAARGLRSLTYPYGNGFDPFKGNTFETHIRQTTPVGVFPEGQTNQPPGLYDLSGNVWEWTRTIWGTNMRTSDYSFPYTAVEAQDGRESTDAPPEARRVVRGGSWYVSRLNARAVYRFRNLPDVRDDGQGLRLVRRPPSQKVVLSTAGE